MNGGRGSSRGGFRGGRGRGRGGKDGGYQPNTGVDSGETPLYNLCFYFIRDGKCQYGDKCRNSHAVTLLVGIPAHDFSIKSLAVLPSDNSKQLITASDDSTMKVWNLASLALGNATVDHTLAAKGPVQCVEVAGGAVLHSADEQLDGDLPGVSIGMVRMLLPASGDNKPIQRSEEFPYTHASQVRNFKVVSTPDGQTYVVTGGGDSMLRTWRYDPVTARFELIATMEGHIRAVTSLLLHESHLWSGSTDRTLRVWDVQSGRCVGVLRSTAGGHTEAVTCLELLPSPAGVFVLSGGADGFVKVWSPAGKHEGECAHPGAMVTSLTTIIDTHSGGTVIILVGLSDGRVMLRSSSSLALLGIVTLDSGPGQQGPGGRVVDSNKTRALWSIKDLGDSHFVAAGDSGYVYLVRLNQSLPDQVTN